MYRPRKYYRGGINESHYGNTYGRERYKCEDCSIVCSSFQQLEQHLNGLKHKRKLYDSSKKVEDNSFPLENMVVLDETEEDLPNENAASPASCDSSDSATAASASGFQTIDHIPRSHMVILDETNDDIDHPASPASCDSSASESTPSSSATAKMSGVTPKKKPRTEKLEDDQTAPVSPFSVVSSGSSSNSAPEAEAVHDTSEKYTGKKHHAKSDKRKRKEEPRKTFHTEPVKSNQDVFSFLKTFAVANDSDVMFAKKVQEMFSKALRKYKEIKLEEIFCTEAEHSSPEEMTGSTDDPNDHEKTNSPILQETDKSECERINSAPESPAASSPPQCVSHPAFSADGHPDSPIINQPNNPDTSSIASRSPTNICEDLDSLDKPSATDSTNDNPCSAAEANLLMESENCVTAEAACSDDDDDDDEDV